MRAPTNQENFDVPAVLTDSCDSVVCTEAVRFRMVDGGVPVGGNEEAAYFAEASVSQAHAASHGCQSSLPVESEEAPIEVVEIDVENCGEISNAPVKNSFYSQAKKHSIHNRDLCDISDDEMDQLPRARPSRELDELVDCNSFRNGTARAASIPPESPSSDKNFIYGEELSPISAKSSEPTISDKYNGILREHPRTGLIRDREISRSPPPPSTLPRDDRRARLENLKKLNFPTKYKMKERIDDVSYGPSTSPYDTYDYTPRRHVRSFLDEPGSEFLSLSVQRQGTDNPIGRNRSPDYSSRRKRRYDDDGERGDDREKNRGGWLNASERRSNRDDWRFERDDRLYTDCQDNGLEDLSNNPLELQRRCNIQIVLSENQVCFSYFSFRIFASIAKFRSNMNIEMKAMRQDEVDMMKAIHADLPAHLQSVVRIEGDNVFINEAGVRIYAAVHLRIVQICLRVSGRCPVTAPPVVMSSFMVPPGMQSMMSGKPTMSGMAPAVPSGLHVQVPESAAVAVTVPPPAESISPDAETGAESTMTSSFANIPSTFSHPPPPISSGPTPGASSSICPVRIFLLSMDSLVCHCHNFTKCCGNL
uniref:Trithorax group protein osa n=1 Tax=Angiostrongylus cantonensis TaxID=6313 RepID=A0A0K0DPH9_ANGCA